MNSQSCDHKPAAPTQRGRRANHARASLFYPTTRKCGSQTKKYNRHRENPDHLTKRPVVRRTGNNSPDSCQGSIENAPGIYRSNTGMNGNRGWWNQPAIEAGLCDDSAALEQLHGDAFNSDVWIMDFLGFTRHRP